MPEHTTLASAFALWSAMMLLMMAPAVAPWAVTFARLAGAPRTMPVTGFLGGYYALWMGYALLGALAQVSLPHVHGLLAGTILLGAGAWQFSPLKQACLRHCRSPLTYFLTAWQDRAPSPLALGLRHGLYCLGCCWALMAVMLAAGAAHVGWMVVLAAVTAAEQTLPRPALLRRAVGAALVGAGAFLLIFPAS